MDPELLVRDTRVYVHALWCLLTDRVLPLDYAAAASALEAELSGLAAKLGVGPAGAVGPGTAEPGASEFEGGPNLSRLIGRAWQLREQAEAIPAPGRPVPDNAEVERLNKALVAGKLRE